MAAQFRSGQRLGWFPPAPNATATAQNNNVANWFAIAFVADAARTLSAVRAYVSAVAGTLAGTDITADLYDSTGASGAPGAALADTGKVPTATITAAGWYDFTGFTVALTANLTYWIVFKNVNATQATNNCTFRAVGQLVDVMTGGGLAKESWGTATSTNSGSTWTTNSTRSGVRISYADGTYDGIPASNSAVTAVGDGVYAAREAGVKFTSPANVVLRVSGLALFVNSKTGSPTGNLRLGLWAGGSSPTLLSYTQTILAASMAFGSYLYGYFSTVQLLGPGTQTRITLGETTQSDASTNRFNMQEITWDTDSNSTPLLPWNGTCQKTYFDGSSTWTDSALGTSIYGHALLLDTAQEFSPGGSPFGQACQ